MVYSSLDPPRSGSDEPQRLWTSGCSVPTYRCWKLYKRSRLKAEEVAAAKRTLLPHDLVPPTVRIERVSDFLIWATLVSIQCSLGVILIHISLNAHLDIFYEVPIQVLFLHFFCCCCCCCFAQNTGSSFPTRERTHALQWKCGSPNHWSIREVPSSSFRSVFCRFVCVCLIDDL